MRSIVHLDADAFFASVEQSTDARLRGKPVAVGGEKRGIIASASYEARKFGIYTPMPTVQARRLCPKLILLPGDFDKYEFFSRLMFSYAYDFTPEVEIGSIDEGYFDLTGALKPAPGIADTIRRAIRQSLKLTVSEGVGSNKLVSQIASKLKKPAAFEVVPPGQEQRFLFPLPNKWLPGIGPKTASQLNAAGLARIGQIACTPAELLSLIVGNLAPQLHSFALGIDERPIIPARAPAKSYSHQETFAADTTDEEFLQATLRHMADKLMAKVREEDKSIRTLTVKVRYNDMDEETASESLPEPTDLETDLYGTVTKLLRQAWKRRVSLRLVSLKFSNLYDARFHSALPLDSSTRQHNAQQRLAGVVDEVRHRFGRRALLRGHDFILREQKAEGGGRRAEGGGQRAEVRGQRSEVRSQAGFQAMPIHGRALATHFPCPTPPTSRITHHASRITHHASRITPHIPLNLHSYYSFLDSTLSINDIIDLAKRYELPAIALTDKNNLHGAIEFAQAAAKAGIKPIIGAEVVWNNQLLWLYVENQTGYHNLCRILGQRAEGRSQKSEVRGQRTEGGGALPLPRRGGDGSSLSHRMGEGRGEGLRTEGLLAVSASPELAPFFPDRFYLKVESLEAFEKQRRLTPLPCVAAFSIHYAEASDRWKYDIVQSIRTLTLLRQQHPEKRLEGEYHFRAPAEMQTLFAGHPELLACSLELAERCNFEFRLGKPQFPSYTPLDGSTPAAFLRRLVLEGLARRYPKDHGRLQSQVQEELAIITEVGYEEYFLVVWDILQECRRRGIEWITRGSAADSLACYCLEISGVCPIRFDLYFRRFLNKERMALNKLPDIDVDFPHDRKDDVVDLIFEKYGPANTAIVGGFSTFQSRSAFAEVAKVLGVSDFQARRITERLPHYSRANDLIQAVATMQECRDLPFEEEPYRTALRMAHFLDGFPRYAKMHPCGLVLSRQPMDEIVPCFTSAKGYPTAHFDMDSIEAAGLIKMDILAQGGLAVMRDVGKMLSSRITHHASRIMPRPLLDLAALEPWTDPEVWELIGSGEARAVHHIESPAMLSLSKMCNVHDIDTLIAIVSVIRPGAANESKKMEFARRYQGLSPVRYPHPSLEACLRSTYGLVVYEEHILQICEAFAGLPPGRADVLRRALGKDKAEVIAEIQVEFVACARKRGRTEAQIAEVWNLVAGFKGYAFCKAHSTAYGVEAYQAAWIKLHFPAHFMAAVLSNGKGFYDPLVYVLECHRLGMSLLGPSVNMPGPGFTVVSSPLPSDSHFPPEGRNPSAEIRKKSECRNPNFPGPPPHGNATFAREDFPFGARISDFFQISTFGFRISSSDFGGASVIQTSGQRNRGEGTLEPMGKTLTPALSHRMGEGQGEGTLQIRVPLINLKGLTTRTKETILSERQRAPFASLPDFFFRVQPLNEEMESFIQAGAFDEFGHSRTAQYWEFKSLCQTSARTHSAASQLWLLPPSLDRLPSVPLSEPARLQRLRWEEALLGYPVSGHPLELFPHIAWDTYCPINRLSKHVGEQIVTCGLVIEQRLFHQATGEPMKFLTIADWTGIVETELFARTYKSYGLATVRYRVLEITAIVEPFENGRGFTLRVLRAGKPRSKAPASA